MAKTKIAVIDDRADARKIVSDVIEDVISNLEITDKWDVLSIAPLKTLKDYTDWVNREKIGILVIDERLGEIPDASGTAANYTGSDLVSLLRTQNKEMPIYGVTSYPGDPSLKEHFALFNEVIERGEFSANASGYVERFLRLYKNFLDTNENELSELSNISRKIALGTATAAEKKRGRAIQESLEIPLTTVAITSRKEWLDEYQKTIEEFKKLQKDAGKFLKEKPAKKKK